MMLLFALLLFLCSGHLCSSEFTVNGTTYFNITGIICKRVENARDILNDKTDLYKGIARNLTQGFEKMYVDYAEQHSEKLGWIKYIITVRERFIWPTVSQEYISNNNLSFAIIAQNEFRATEEAKRGFAEIILSEILWDKFLLSEKDDRGCFNSEGLKIKYKKVKDVPVMLLQNLTNGYMEFIAKMKNTIIGGGNKPPKTSSGNSSGQPTFNSSVKTTSSGPHEISYIAYIGITLSMIGLLITMTSICYFRRLRKFRRNQILVHICATIMAGMLLSIISFTYKGDNSYCTALAMLLHYFILAAVSWMCVEAYNLYRDLVKVYNTSVISSKAFALRACLFAYGLPAIIVSITSIVDINAYGQRNDACWMMSLAFLVSFLAPVLLIVSVNLVFFSLIMREIIQVSQRDANNIRPSLRAAVSLSVVLGFCWLLAGISTFTTNHFVTYAFVIMSSFQGLFIFIFHGIGKKELRDSWKSLPIFNWQFNKFTNTESQGRGKTESTTQDTPPVSKRYSTDVGETGKLTKDLIPPTVAGFSTAYDAGHNQACAQEGGLSTSNCGYGYGIPEAPEQKHGPLKNVESDC